MKFEIEKMLKETKRGDDLVIRISASKDRQLVMAYLTIEDKIIREAKDKKKLVQAIEGKIRESLLWSNATFIRLDRGMYGRTETAQQS